MGLPALNFEEELGQEKLIDIETYIRGTHTEEIIIGLCGPIGTDVSFVADRVKRMLEDNFNYECNILQLSNFIKDQFKEIDFEKIKRANPTNYYEELINKGNELRAEHSNSVLAKLAINEITIKREMDKEAAREGEFKSKRRCYIIDSIKHSEELELFRLVYRELFYFISVFATLDTRKKV